jgi:hypothetical protein
MKDKTSRQLVTDQSRSNVEAFASSHHQPKPKSVRFSFPKFTGRSATGAWLAMAVALASLASSALASLAAALIAIWMCSRFVLPRIISFAVRRPRDRPRAFVSPEKTRVPSASSTRI